MPWYPDDIHKDGEYLCPDLPRKKASITLSDFIGMVVIPPVFHMSKEQIDQLETWDLHWERDRERILAIIRRETWHIEYSFDKYEFDEYVNRKNWITQIDSDTYRIAVWKYFGSGECFVDDLSYHEGSLERAFGVFFPTFFRYLYHWGE